MLGEANCIQGLGDIALARSNYEAARASFEEALIMYERFQEPYSIGMVRRQLARVSTSPQKREALVAASRSRVDQYGP